MKKNYILIALTAICLASCNQPGSSIPSESETPSAETKLSSIDIVKDSYSINELDVLVNDTFTLNIKANDSLTPAITWDSANDEIVKIDENGVVTVVGSGSTIITATATDYPYITDSVYVNATRKVEQTGIGSGKSKDDPIFLGNEGDDQPIEIYFIEMQQIYGDSIFIKKGNVEILIDSGYAYDGKTVNKVLTEHCADKRLDLLMASHSDGDHIDGFANSLPAIDNVSLMVDYGGQGSGNVKNARTKYGEKGMVYHSAYDCVNGLNGAADRYYLTSEFYFDVLDTGNYVTADAGSAGNGKSVAVIFTYKDFTFFTAGDLTTSSESDLLRRESLPEVTLYKASHHGSHGSNSQTLLDTLNPKGVAISASIAGSYGKEPSAPNPNNTTNLNAASGHPAAEAIGRIYKAPNISQNLNVFWNGVNGTMKFTSYGTDSFEFEGSTPLKGYYDLTLTNGTPVWDETIKDFKNKVTGEENYRFHETKAFQFRDYIKYLPTWAQEQYYPNYTA